ncbi:hypothetical protein C477_14543 [Haloterrigena salina JCM 13891]|uniref:Uncharacterized protein n=1 Tax=Haloterrigena salina JCM 13891 TaxID=1227488 RepID=M0C2E0_9EURY|nr:hypothetical protein C477_14543 [Haloterrigena salina JCM 13891]
MTVRSLTTTRRVILLLGDQGCSFGLRRHFAGIGSLQTVYSVFSSYREPAVVDRSVERIEYDDRL